MFKGQTYNGSSFLEFLRTDHPSQLPDFGGWDWAKLELLQATTVLALVYDDGVLMAGDRLATEGVRLARATSSRCSRSITAASWPLRELLVLPSR